MAYFKPPIIYSNEISVADFNCPKIFSNKKVSSFLLLKTPFRNAVLSQQARSAKFQAETAVNKREFLRNKNSRVKNSVSIFDAVFKPPYTVYGYGVYLSIRFESNCDCVFVV